MRCRLTPHPSAPANLVSAVTVEFSRDTSGGFWIEYEVASAAAVILPSAQRPERADELWNSTCFELFARTKGSEEYIELNFSPSFQWAAYAFSGYRTGRCTLPTHDPEIWISRPGDWFFLAVEALPDLGLEPLQFGISAVIEEEDGIKSYWALAHPPGDKPDFHDPACFALELPWTANQPSSPRT
jgi:hypothetical protein